MQTFKRQLALTFGALVAGAAIAMAVAAPAQADAASCKQYLQDKGYSVGTGVTTACTTAQNGGAVKGYAACKEYLLKLGVTTSHAHEACLRGTR